MVLGFIVGTGKIALIEETLVESTFLLNKMADLLKFGVCPEA
jgi:hypothetical protein